MNIGKSFDAGLAKKKKPQFISDDLVEALTETGSFFMPQGLVVVATEYVEDKRTSIPLQGNVVLVEISRQKIFEYKNRLSIKLSGKIIEGFSKPREFTFHLSHSYPEAKVFPGRDNIQTFELSEFLRLEYPEIPLVATDATFCLDFLDFNENDDPEVCINGRGSLRIGS